MRGRQVFMDSLRAHGVEAIFGNPGTTENPLLDSLIDYPQIDYYVALHEGVAVGMAGYYARARGTTGVTSLHVAPGLGNAIGMLYGALKACAPMVVTAGQQDNRFRLRDPILGHDLVSLAAPVTKWAVEPNHADELGAILRRAFRIAHEPPAGPVFVALPVNVMEQETDNGAETAGILHTNTPPEPAAVSRLAEILLASNNPAIVAGDEVAESGACAALRQLAESTGASVYVEFLRARQPIPFDHPAFRGRVPYEADKIAALFAPHDVVVMLGGPFFEEVWFDDGPFFPAETLVVQVESAPSRLAYNHSLDLGVLGHMPAVLEVLNTAIEAGQGEASRAGAAARNATLAQQRAQEAQVFETQLARFAGQSPMAASEAMAVIGRNLPADAIVVDESITASIDVSNVFSLGQGEDFFSGRGGGIGQGVAGALGVAVAKPRQPVVVLSGDGSAMYSIQALWTAAHHKLRIVFVILSNAEYRILKHNLDTYRQRFGVQSDKPYPHMNLSEPPLGFVDMARGMGVPASRVTRAEALEAAFVAACETDGPVLIEAAIAGKPA